MTETTLANEPAIRLGFFFGIFALMVLWEFVMPRRERSVSRWIRWPCQGAPIFTQRSSTAISS